MKLQRTLSLAFIHVHVCCKLSARADWIHRSRCCRGLLRCCCIEIREYTSLPIRLSYDFCFHFDSIVAVHRRRQSKSHRNKLCMQSIPLIVRVTCVCVFKVSAGYCTSVIMPFTRCINSSLLSTMTAAAVAASTMTTPSTDFAGKRFGGFCAL